MQMNQRNNGLRKGVGLAFLLGLTVLTWQAGQDILETVQLASVLNFEKISRRAIAWVFFMIANGAILYSAALRLWGRGPCSPGSRFMRMVSSVRSRRGTVGSVLAGIVLLVPPVMILHLQNEDLIGQGALRFWILVFTASVFSVLVTKERDKLVGGLPFLVGMLALTVVFKFMADLTRVTGYPFALGWSEGNRLYDYSMIFGRSIYTSDYPVALPYYAPGRYALWGLPFIFDGLPIAVHRLWDALLWSLVPVLLGWLLLPQVNWKWRIGLGLWVAVFIYQGPIYPTILISAILVCLAFNSGKATKWLGVLGGSLFAGLSRWTWSAAVGVWGAVLEQLHRPLRNKPFILRFLPAGFVLIAGSLPGIIANLPRLLTPKETTLSLSQPLLWYRLFPNATYPPGILIALAIAVIPLVVFLVWLNSSRRWYLDGYQITILVVSCAGLLTAGLVASTKIGGGSNLHNLDMFFLLLVFILGAALREQVKANEIPFHHWPPWVKVLIFVGVLTPAWTIFSQGGPMVLPPQDLARAYVEDIQRTVDSSRGQGEILFIDQRQLLTFRAVKNVDLVPDYEKKYMMDQAMAGNAAYFASFYQDLASHRFSLVITDPLFLVEQGGDYSFGEENDAYVKWVSRPLLCYYEIKDTLTEVRVQYLVPRQGPAPKDMGCP